MPTVAAGIALLAFASWLVAAVSWIQLLGHRADGVRLSTVLLRGVKSFDPATFKPSGEPYRRRFIGGFVGFLVFAVAGVVFGALASGAP